VPPHGGQILPASLSVKGVEDGCQHDRTPLFDQVPLITGSRFRKSSRGMKNGFVSVSSGTQPAIEAALT
jgi:hypothetical protein